MVWQRRAVHADSGDALCVVMLRVAVHCRTLDCVVRRIDVKDRDADIFDDDGLPVAR